MAVAMPYRRVGASGLKVSALGLGGWTTFGGSVTDAELTSRILHRALDAGVNFFDIADIYAKGASETMMGAALRDVPRHKLVLSSKVFWPMSDDVNDRGLSRKHVMESVEKSLRRMQTDYLDMYFCHRFDVDTPVEETVRAMDDLVTQGKILYWGTSEWSGAQMRDAHAIASSRNHQHPVVEQPQYSLVARTAFESDVAPSAVDLGMGLVVWSPLGSGFLSGKYDDGVPSDSRLARMDWLRDQLLTDKLVERSRAFARFARDRGVSRTRLALAYALRHPAVSSVILGATSVEQLDENLSSLDVALSSEDVAALNDLFP
jgi:voltage-dependent potassium channel beta subunit